MSEPVCHCDSFFTHNHQRPASAESTLELPRKVIGEIINELRALGATGLAEKLTELYFNGHRR